jgi:hypothetical protein
VIIEMRTKNTQNYRIMEIRPDEYILQQQRLVKPPFLFFAKPRPKWIQTGIGMTYAGTIWSGSHEDCQEALDRRLRADEFVPRVAYETALDTE